MLKRRSSLVFILIWLSYMTFGGFNAEAQEKSAEPAPEPELSIVKYGKVSVKSPLPDTKVSIDDLYKGVADITIENVTTGQHTVSLQQGDRKITGSFTVKKDETLRLEARFDEGKIVSNTEMEKAEAEKRKKAEAAKLEEQKRLASDHKKAEPKTEQKAEPKVFEDDSRSMHRTIIKVFFEDIDTDSARVRHAANTKVITRYIEKKNKIGKYFRTKMNILLCDAGGPCEQFWSASFTYTDETGRSDSFVMTWKQIVFSGVTPEGTSKRELEWCLNGACKHIDDADTNDTTHESDADHYHLSWTKSLAIINRTDVK